ncbi:hypothetical protein [Kribbella sp. C-35]|uniref:hypothetical protein n=1 Tax=Kribbella sp. C-35 TaxID=2789276 RepID=UPI00397E8C89
MGILRHPDFRRLWAADLLSQLGSRLSMGAIPLLAVLTLNASTLQVSLLRTCETAAWLILGLFAGAWADRIRCRATRSSPRTTRSPRSSAPARADCSSNGSARR